jgi:hypothetical protein
MANLFRNLNRGGNYGSYRNAIATENVYTADFEDWTNPFIFFSIDGLAR